jgi:hypothetical protein
MDEAITVLVILVLIVIPIAVVMWASLRECHEQVRKRDESGEPVKMVPCSGCGKQVDSLRSLCSSCAWDMISMGS